MVTFLKLTVLHFESIRMIFRLSLVDFELLRYLLKLLPEPSLIIFRFLMHLLDPKSEILFLLQIGLNCRNLLLQSQNLFLTVFQLQQLYFQSIEIVT